MKVEYKGHSLLLREGETVLEACERSGIHVPTSCRVGVCHFCVIKSTHGKPSKRSQEGLSEEHKSTGHFKSCVCIPEEDLQCEEANTADFRGYTQIEAIEPIGIDIARVRLRRPQNFTFRPGQFVTFRLKCGHARSYSIASQFDSRVEYFDIHVRRVPQGKLSSWFHDEANPGDEIWFEGPRGDCFYSDSYQEDEIVLIGTGTGMAPLYGIMVDALSNGHAQNITIIQGALNKEKLYLIDEINELTSIYKNLNSFNCALQGPSSDRVHMGDLRELAFKIVEQKANQRVFLCGDPGLVRHLKKHFFLRGTSMTKLHADPFEITTC